MDFGKIAQKALGNVELFTKRNAPTILTGVGIAGYAATAVMVGKGVLSAQHTVDNFRVQKDRIAKKNVTDSYTNKDKAKDMGELHIAASKALLKDFWPAITLGAASTVCVIASLNLQKRQQASLLAAYSALDAGFKAYRKRVTEELGEEKELQFYRGVRASKEGTLENGEACIINDYDPDSLLPSPYAKFFDASSTSWSKQPEYNLMFLRSQQQSANDQLRARGHLFLNEVYDSLGLERTQAGQVVGWIYNDRGDGDGYVDFGLYLIGDEGNRAFVNGLDDSVLLDFNVDGPIKI